MIKQIVSLPVGILDKLVASPIRDLSEWVNDVQKPSPVIKTQVSTIKGMTQEVSFDEFVQLIIDNLTDPDLLQEVGSRLKHHPKVEHVVVLRGYNGGSIDTQSIEAHVRELCRSAIHKTEITIHKQGTRGSKKPQAIVMTAHAA